jgi:hypothetical protein
MLYEKQKDSLRRYHKPPQRDFQGGASPQLFKLWRMRLEGRYDTR